jgi:hypothetical protein
MSAFGTKRNRDWAEPTPLSEVKQTSQIRPVMARQTALSCLVDPFIQIPKNPRGRAPYIVIGKRDDVIFYR